MAASHALYCASNSGVNDPDCFPTASIPPIHDSASKYAAYYKVLGCSLFVFSLFCLYFLILFSYKVLKGYSLYYSFRFAFCGAQRVLYNRTIRLGVSLFVTPVPVSATDVVLAVLTHRACHPTNASTPLPVVVLEMTQSPIYSVPGDAHTESSLGVVVVESAFWFVILMGVTVLNLLLN